MITSVTTVVVDDSGCDRAGNDRGYRHSHAGVGGESRVGCRGDPRRPVGCLRWGPEAGVTVESRDLISMMCSVVVWNL